MQQPSGCCNVYSGKTARYEGKGMEMFDIRTPEGEPTGEVKERSAVHRDVYKRQKMHCAGLVIDGSLKKRSKRIVCSFVNSLYLSKN